MNQRDANHQLSLELPPQDENVYAFLDTGVVEGHQLGEIEFRLRTPSMADDTLPEGETFTFSVVMCDALPATGKTTLMPSFLIIQGVEDLGSPGFEKKFRMPSDAKRYIGIEIQASVGTGPTSGLNATLEMLF